MKLQGIASQVQKHHLWVADGSIIAGGTPQLLVPERPSCCYLTIQNTSSANLYLEFGGARATATVANGAVTAIAVINNGINYTAPPNVHLLGGAYDGNNLNQGVGLPGGASPRQPAVAHAVLSGSTVGSIVVDYGGSDYATAPYVFLSNKATNPNASAAPSASSGIVLAPQGSFTMENSAVTTDAIAVFGATTGQTYICRWMD